MSRSAVLNAGTWWFEADSGIQMYIICLIWLPLISSSVNVHHFLVWQFCSESPQSLIVCYAMNQIWWPLFRLFARNTVCDVLMGWSCSGDLQLLCYPMLSFLTWNSLLKWMSIKHQVTTYSLLKTIRGQKWERQEHQNQGHNERNVWLHSEKLLAHHPFIGVNAPQKLGQLLQCMTHWKAK